MIATGCLSLIYGQCAMPGERQIFFPNSPVLFSMHHTDYIIYALAMFKNKTKIYKIVESW